MCLSTGTKKKMQSLSVDAHNELNKITKALMNPKGKQNETHTSKCSYKEKEKEHACTDKYDDLKKRE